MVATYCMVKSEFDKLNLIRQIFANMIVQFVCDELSHLNVYE